MGLASITNNIITDTSIPSANVITGTLASGQVAYGSAANTIAGSNNLFWSGTALGVGTNTPSTTLHVSGSTLLNGAIELTPTIASGDITIGNGGYLRMGSTRFRAFSTSFVFQDNAYSNKVILNTGGGFTSFVNGAGNYGFGTDTDDGVNKLQVAGSAKITGDTLVTGNLTMNRSGGGTFSVQGNQFLHDAVSTVGQLVFISSTGSAGKMIFPSATSGMNLFPGANNELNGSAHLRITSRLLNNANGVQVSIATNASGAAIVGTFAATGTYGLDSLNNLNGGSLSGVRIAETFTANIATQNIAYSGFTFVSTINQSTAVGLTAVTRGVHINPTLTAAVDFRAIEWSNNAATAPAVSWGLYGAGTAPNLLNGNLIIGPSALSQAAAESSLHIGRPLNAQTSYGATIRYESQNGAIAAHGLNIQLSTQNAAYTTSNIYGVSVLATVKGALNTITNQYGFFVNSTFTAATNNYAYYGDIPANAGSWNLYMNGTAANYLNGSLLVGSATDDGINKLQVTGNANITGAISVGSGPSDFAGTMRTTNSTVPATGAGLEFGYLTGTSTGVIVSYNRGTPAYTALTINASTLNLNTGSNGTVNFGTGNAVIPGKVRSGASSGTSAYVNIGINNVSEAQLNLATSTFTPTSPVNGDLWFNGTDVKFRISGVTTNFITGALTSGYVPKATGTSSIANSLIYDNGTSVLVNTNTAIPTPTTGTYSHAFQVLANAAGGMIVSTTNTASGIGIVNSSSTNKTWDISPFNNDLAINESGVGARMYFLSGGNITVGGITNSGNLLEVLGTFKTTGVNTLSNLGGVGSRMVVADANGVLSTQAIPGGSITGSGVAGQVTYWSGASSLTGDNNFFWDSVNGNLGIGINTPTRKIDILTNANNSQLVNIRNNSTGTSSVAGFQAQNSTQTASLFLTSTGYTTNGVIDANTMTLYSANASNIAIAVNSTGYFSIGTGNVTPTEKLRMFNNGNVLIQDGGVYNDGGERLQVIGRAIANNSITQGAFGTGNRIGLFGAQTIDVPTVGPFNQGTVTAAGTSVQYMTFNGNTTIGGDALVAGSVHINSVQFATTGTITMADSATNKPRTLSVMQLQMQKAGTIGGTITKGSTLYLFGVYPTTSTGGTVTFTEYAGLRIGNLTEWTGGTPPNTTVDLTNRWGIYQEGDTDPNYFAGSVGIGVATNNASAKLQVNSTTQGFLPPRMTNAQMNAIATPAAGLIVYNTTDNKHYGYNGTTWNAFY